MESAVAAGDAIGRGDALRGLAGVTSLQGDRTAAQALFDEARVAYESVGAQDPIGALLNHRGNDAFRLTLYDAAERHWLEALGVYQASGNLPDQASLLRNLTFLPRLSIPDKLSLLDEAMALATAVGDRERQGLIRASQGDKFVAVGDYAAALTHQEAAVALLENSRVGRVHFARALTSLGRTNRLLGNPQQSIEMNGRAAPMLDAEGDFEGAAQAYHAIALAILDLRPSDKEADRLIDHALALARKSGRPGSLFSMLRARALFELDSLGNFEGALILLDEADALPVSDQFRWLALSTRAKALNAAGRPLEALAKIDKAIGSEGEVIAQQRAGLYETRAIILERLGRMADAIDSVSQAIATTEAIRDRLVPADQPRRTYAENVQGILARHVRLLAQSGRMEEALVASERARARAFMDLLATREDQPREPPGPAPSSMFTRASVPPLAMRGPDPGGTPTIDDLVT
ncbi:MAG: hypothetical protein ACREUF_00750, partial [Solimonas sp.]